ncbi:MAG: hypothetical protein QXW82_03950 [Candidatus Bathyarchaeia archaeon]
MKFIKGPPKQMEITVKNDGDASCGIKNIVRIKPSSCQSWTDVQVTWDLATLPPKENSKTCFVYNWTSGRSYFIKVITEEEFEALALEQAP